MREQSVHRVADRYHGAVDALEHHPRGVDDLQVKVGIGGDLGVRADVREQARPRCWR
ncbi:hypothetical protein [Streptomyces sp. NPDC048419]|uniref:hypothetical protein n=1 Tax=Streptomyces sp. NPDC048419 TaxID=3365547 RepID=UPI00371F1D07